MCLGSIYWARIDKIYYGCRPEDAAAINFDDKFIYDELKKDLKDRLIPCYEHERDYGKKVFDKWAETTSKVAYWLLLKVRKKKN